MIKSIRTNVPLKISKAGALDEAYAKVGKKGRVIKDAYAKIGYDMGDYILVAKTYGIGIVSCHKSLLSFCKPIVMYLQDTKHFYKFGGKEIMADPESYPNSRGNVPMWNFKLDKLGKRWEPDQIEVSTGG